MHNIFIVFIIIQINYTVYEIKAIALYWNMNVYYIDMELIKDSNCSTFLADIKVSLISLAPLKLFI